MTKLDKRSLVAVGSDVGPQIRLRVAHAAPEPVQRQRAPEIRRRTWRVDTLSTSAASLTVKNLSAPASAWPADTRPRAALKSWPFNLSRELIATSLNWKVAEEAKE